MKLDRLVTGLLASAALVVTAGLGSAAAAAGVGVTPPQTGPSTLLLRAQYSPVVERVQRGLNNLGYDAGPVDGLMGARTRRAIEAYQRDRGLLVTGQPSVALADHLEAMVAARAAEQEQRRRDRRRDADRERAVDEETIAEIQSELRRRGYAVPVVTGRADAETEAAIRRYERDRGMRQTGQPSRSLLAALQAEPPAGERERIRAVQTALGERGYRVGTPDGLMGPATVAAIRTYQSDTGMRPTGQITPELLASLGIEEAPPPPPAEPPAAVAETPPTVAETPPALRPRLVDDFADGDFTRNPPWRVLSGEFRVEDGRLVTRVETATADPQREIGQALLRDVLGGALGVAVPGQARSAAITHATWIGNAFAVDVRLAGQDRPGARLDFGPYRQADAASGYRLAYVSGESRPLRLLAVTEGRSATIATADPGVDLLDGQMRLIQWARDAEGRMTVAIDERTVLEARDRTIAGDFDGFSIVNRGGAWSVDSVSVAARVD